MRSIKFSRLKTNQQLVAKSIELQEKGLTKNQLKVLGKSNSRNIFQRKRVRIATDSQAKRQGEQREAVTRNSFIRYKTESIKDKKQERYQNGSIDNIFKSHSMKPAARKKGLFQEAEVKAVDQMQIRIQTSQIVIRDFNSEISHAKRSKAVDIFKYKLAHKCNDNYLFVPIHNFDGKPGEEGTREQQQNKIRQNINLPLIRQIANTDQRKNRPTSLLLDIQRSLLVIQKKEAAQKEPSQRKSRNKSRLIIRGSNTSNTSEDLHSLSPWIEDHPTPPSEQLFY